MAANGPAVVQKQKDGNVIPPNGKSKKAGRKGSAGHGAAHSAAVASAPSGSAFCCVALSVCLSV